MFNSARPKRSTSKVESARAQSRTSPRFSLKRKSSIPPAKSPATATTEGVPSRRELQKMFRKFDANNDGKISLPELRSVVSALGRNASDEEVKSMMREADADGDGFINFEEFIAVNTKGVNAAKVLKDVETAFKMYDVDKSGGICVEELYKVMTNLGEEASLQECRRMINEADLDQNGLVSLEEFKNMMMSPRQ